MCVFFCHLGIITVYKTTPYIQCWDEKTGKLNWQRVLGSTNNKVLHLSDDSDSVVVLSGNKVYKLATENGAIVWEQEVSVGGAFLQQAEQVIYVIQTPETTTSSFRIFALDSTNGQVIHSDIRVATSQPLVIAPIAHGNALVWKEKDLIKWNVLGTKKVHQVALKVSANQHITRRSSFVSVNIYSPCLAHHRRLQMLWKNTINLQPLARLTLVMSFSCRAKWKPRVKSS
jgi:outer membrane protein assembly factor BamB